MISVAEAKKIIRDSVMPLPALRLPLQEAAGLVLAEDVYATIDIPAFPQSSMDGYAISFEGWQLHKRLQVKGEIPAGSDKPATLDRQHAARIFTGAPVPGGADTVVMQEKVIVENGQLLIEDENLKAGTNVRPRGSEVKAETLALAKETYLSPAAIGFLAGAGIAEVSIYRKPLVSIIVTGKELQQPGNALQYGQVYESNSYTLSAALQQLSIFGITTIWADDDLEILKNILSNALEQSDVVLLTGGISVGDYDFVLEAVTACGVSKLFHKIRQRPGKPLYFGKKETKLVFGLPGNPSSVLTCFYEYVVPALEAMGRHKSSVQVLHVPLAKQFQKAPGLTHFLKGYFDGQTVSPLDAQESYRLSSFAKANCLVQIDEATTKCDEGEMIEIHLLPN